MADAIPNGCSEIFAPCLDPHCQRPCGARRTIAEINIDINRERSSSRIWLALVPLFAAGAILALVSIGQQAASNINNTIIAEREP